MRTLTKIVALMVLALWSVASMHCTLEHLPGFTFLACCQHPDTEPHQDNDCESDACAVVESGLYKIEDQPAMVLCPSLLCTVSLDYLDPLPCQPADVFLSIPETGPPELAPLWTFTQRTSLPPRAPCIPA